MIYHALKRESQIGLFCLLAIAQNKMTEIPNQANERYGIPLSVIYFV